MRIYAFVVFLFFMCFNQCAHTQTDNYILIDHDDFEYTTSVPYVVPLSLNDWFDIPREDCAPEGNRSLFMNFRDNYTGISLNREMEVCVGAGYYFEWIMGNCYIAEDNNPFFVKPSVTVIIVDGNGVEMYNNSWVDMLGWQTITTPPFYPTSPILYFRLYTDIPGTTSGNDLTFDDLRFYQNNPIYHYETETGLALELCSVDSPINLADSLFAIHSSGVWDGPSALTSTTNGTFDPSINTSGTYTFVTLNSAICPDTTTVFPIIVGTTPILDNVVDITECGSYVLPQISGIDLSGNEAYYTQPNGIGVAVNEGFEVFTTTTFYIYDESTMLSKCSSEIEFTVTVNDAPDAGNDFSNSYCLPHGSALTLTDLIGTHDNNGEWTEVSSSPSGEFNTITSAFNLNAVPDGTYEFIYVVPQIGSCDNDTAFVIISVYEAPVIELFANDTVGCVPDQITFQAGTSDNVNFVYNWNFGNGETSNNQNALASYTTVGCYDINLTVSNNGECPTSVSETDFICIYPTPQAIFTMDQDSLTALEPVLTGTNLSINADSFFWMYGDGASSTNIELNHSYEGLPGGYYNVTLIALTSQGCSDTMIQQIFMYNQFYIETPNVFTPNNDGVNDLFTIRVEGVAALEWVVLNRWGNVLSQGAEELSPASHIITLWNGIIEGQESPEGVYFYRISYTDSFGEKGNEHGHITLVR